MGLFSNFNGINCDNKSFNFIEKMDVKKHIIMNALEKFSRKQNFIIKNFNHKKSKRLIIKQFNNYKENSQ